MRFAAPARRVLSCILAVLILSLASGTLAQTPQTNRIASQPDLTRTTRLTGHLPAWVVPSSDAGFVPDETPIRLTLVLARSPELQAAFEHLLADQQNPASPRFHQWLTPTQVGEQFGPTLNDIDALTGWLTASGLHLVEVSPARVFLTVTGTTGVVSTTFATTFHRFLYNGEPRLSAAAEPAIPAAFASVISSVDGLTDLPVHPMLHSQLARPRAAPNSVEPLYSSGDNATHYVFPGDFAAIYDINPATSAGYNGAGVRVAVIGRSRIANSDVTELEALAQLPQRTPTVVLVPGSADPGIVTSNNDTDEVTLDVDRVITTALGAPVDMVIAAQASGGIAAAMQYNVNTLLDPIMSLSFGLCESAAGAAGVNFYNTLFAQAAAQGISVFVSSGDAAAAGCSGDFSTPTGKEVLAMGNYICSNPYATCVGGTEFNDTNPLAYWAPGQTTAPFASALGYIPEGAWNEPTKVNSDKTTVFQIAGSGSGPSAFIAKPSWQTGTGVPADGARDTPDVAFTASLHDGIFGCLAYMGDSYDCNKGGGIGFYGTSVATPSMAAIAAILNQRLGTSQGSLNPLLYRLAASNPDAFHDATPASSGVANCTTATATTCNNSVASPTGTSGGLAGYPLQVGYDLVTGLGSLDVAKFLNAAAAPVPTPTPTPTPTIATTLSVNASPASIPVGTSTLLTATIKPASTGANSPSGTITFYANGAAIASPVPVANSAATLTYTPNGTAGTILITASYSGDTTYQPSSAPSFTLVATAAPGISASVANKVMTLSAGASTGNTTVYSLNSINGFVGTVGLTCSVVYNGGTATFPPTCSFAASTLTLAANATQTTVLTVSTTLPHAAQSTQSFAWNRLLRHGSLALLSLSGLLILLPVRRGTVHASHTLWIVPAVLIAVSLLSLSGCARYTSKSTPTPTPTPVGTSTGSYTITIVATPTSGSAAAATTTIALTVQ